MSTRLCLGGVCTQEPPSSCRKSSPVLEMLTNPQGPSLPTVPQNGLRPLVWRGLMGQSWLSPMPQNDAETTLCLPHLPPSGVTEALSGWFQDAPSSSLPVSDWAGAAHGVRTEDRGRAVGECPHTDAHHRAERSCSVTRTLPSRLSLLECISTQGGKTADPAAAHKADAGHPLTGELVCPHACIPGGWSQHLLTRIPLLSPGIWPAELRTAGMGPPPAEQGCPRLVSHCPIHCLLH